MPTVKIGVLTDLAGQNSKTAGPVAVTCAQQAVADFNPLSYGFDVEIVAGDHLNQAAVGKSIAEQWFDLDDVDVITDLNNSSVALAVSQLAVVRDKAILNTGAVSTEISGSGCTPNMVNWAFDSWMLAHSTGREIVKTGGKTWFFIAPDYKFGTSMVNETADVVRAGGGAVLGAIYYSFPGDPDFYPALLNARLSEAAVVGLAGTGDDLERCIRQSTEFGFRSDGIRLVALVGFITNVRSLGLKQAQGMLITETFYWDLNDRTRAFSRRVLARTRGTVPNSEQAAQYSAVTHYLKAVASSGVARAKSSGSQIIAEMKKIPVDDDAFGPGELRADGRKVQPVYLFEVKQPRESKSEWDVYKLVATIPASRAYRPFGEGGCYMSK